MVTIRFGPRRARVVLVALALTAGDLSGQTITAQYCTPAGRATESATLARVLLTPLNPMAG
jgi:hypothetical protein